MKYCKILFGFIILLSGCAPAEDEGLRDLGSGDKSNLPVSLDLLIRYAEYSKEIYDNGGQQKDEVHFEVKQGSGITIIVIRGTANESNVKSDINIELVKDLRSGMYLHNGFRTASSVIMEILDRDYTVGNTVHITGHSLGGAIAQILGIWFHRRGHNVKIFSYGSPKISNQSSDQPRHWRVVHKNDPVPFMPTWPYRHTGVFINSQTLDWGPDNDNGLISETDALDHSIAKYLTTLKENL